MGKVVSPSLLVSIRVIRVIRGFLLLWLRRQPCYAFALTSAPALRLPCPELVEGRRPLRPLWFRFSG